MCIYMWYFYLEKDINVYKFEKCVYIRILKIYNQSVIFIFKSYIINLLDVMFKMFEG